MLFSAAPLLGAEPPELPPPASEQIDFARQIEPIFRAKCYSCHDADGRESGLQLDDKSAALAGGDSGPAIVPGNSAESLLVRAVARIDEDLQMPPDGEGTPLTRQEVARIRAWIDQGAHWPDQPGSEQAAKSDHWSLQPIRDPEPPAIDDPWIRNEIDAFILRRLEQQGVRPSPEAPRSTLIRRLFLDLVGLPPTPAQLQRWMSDPGDDWYERLVDQLLDSPHYGERWARHWLDLARYADSDGYEKDRARPHAWRWRDWVIRALNADMPFDQFSIEQLAGDLLPGATLEQRVATGFHRNTLVNREGGTDPEEDRVKRTVDRTNTLGAVWLGMTVECAQCHSHKYDPLTQREYYGLYAFFNSLVEPDIGAPLPEQRRQYKKAKAAFDREHARYEKAIEQYEQTQLAEALQRWEAEAQGAEPVWIILRPQSVRAEKGTQLEVLDDGSVLASGENPGRAEVYTIVCQTELSAITGIRLEAIADPRLPGGGPGRDPLGNFQLTMFEVSAAPLDGSAPPEPVELTAAKADFSQQGQGVERAINNSFSTGWAIAPRTGQSHVATFQTKEPVGSGGGTRLVISMRQSSTLMLYHNLGRFRLSVTTSKPPLPLHGLTDLVARTLNVPAEQRTAMEQEDLVSYYRMIDPQLARLRREAEQHARKAPPSPYQQVKAQVVAEMDPPRKTHVLIRGDFLQPGAPVEPQTPAVLPPLKARGARPDRLDLARWLFDPAHPLTARVAVNRIWQRHFGRGIVPSVNDFGTQGDRPSHPELLDWLATWFRKNGWSLKALHRLIVTSATYRQSSRARPELADRDPYNSWLSHQNRLRVEAEIVRDLALSVSGLIQHRVGGPSVRPPQPEGLDMLGYANSIKWRPSQGADRYRRGLYTFFQRTVPYPMLMTFDAPDSNLSCTRRERSNTPLQALTLWNDPVFFECAQALGRRISAYRPAADQRLSPTRQRLRYAFLLCLSREPSRQEMDTLDRLYREELKFCQADEQAALKIIGGQPLPEGAGAPELAAWILVGRTLINLDEFITRG